MESAVLGVVYSVELEGVSSLPDLKVRIRSPSGTEFVPQVHQSSVDECRIEWTPFELGVYTLNAQYFETPVKGTPLKIKTFDPKRVQVYNLRDGYVMKQNIFCVDASQAGEGSLEIGISCDGRYIPNQVKPLGNSKFEVQFMPQEPIVHFANINFNSESVKGGFFLHKKSLK